MNKEFEQVREFITQVRGVSLPTEITELTLSQQTDRYRFMREECEEFAEGWSIPEQVDALVDLHYFLIGTLLEMGVSAEVYEQCFDEVHRANMRKRAGKKEGREVSGVDASKPDGWEEPDLETILTNYMPGRIFKEGVDTMLTPGEVTVDNLENGISKVPWKLVAVSGTALETDGLPEGFELADIRSGGDYKWVKRKD